MPKLLGGLTGLVLLALALRFGALAFSDAWENAGDTALHEAREALLAHYDRTGQFPGSMSLSASRVWGFSGPKLTYSRDQEGCKVFFYLWPLGPHQGIDCITGNQHHEE